MKKYLLAVGLAITCFFSRAAAQEIPVLEFYHGAECPHCHEEIKWFPTLQAMYPSLEVREFEVWHDPKNKRRWQERMAELGQKLGAVPTNIMGSDIVVGFEADKIIAMVSKQLGAPKIPVETPPAQPSTENSSPSEIPGAPTQEVFWKSFLTWSWPAMSFALGLIDGFNPCAMWTLLILLGFLLTMDDRKKRWIIGAVFISSSGIIYGAALVAYLYGFSEISIVATSMMGWIFRAVGLLAVGTGALSLWASRKAKIECDVRDAHSKKKFHIKMSKVLERENFWMVLLGVIGIAFSVNAVELLCSFAIPTTFTATIISLNLSFFEKITSLLIYIVAYELDDIIVFGIAMWTLSLTVFSPKIVRASHFFGGIFLLILGLWLIINPSSLSTFAS